MRQAIGGLQLISQALRSNPDIQQSLVVYEVKSPLRITYDSRYIYSPTDDCSDIVQELDRIASEFISGLQRSLYGTSSSTALEFVLRHVPISDTRTTSVITITDGFSDENENARIATLENGIKTNRKVNFFSVGVRNNNPIDEKNMPKFQAELLALAGSDESRRSNIDGSDITNKLVEILENADVLCTSQGMKRYTPYSVK